MDKPKPTSKPLTHRPGEDLASAMLRELARNPDSPASLHIRSAVNRAMAPRVRAAEQLVAALADQLEQDGHSEAAAVQAAIAHWERTCETSLPADLLAEMREEARSRVARSAHQVPSIASILGESPRATDTGYQLGVHMEGLQGTWHRLWACMALCHSLGGPVDSDPNVLAIRAQFEQLLGRALDAKEWAALRANAVAKGSAMGSGEK